MPLLNDQVKKEVIAALTHMVKPVTIKLFSQEFECGYCKETHELMNDMLTTSDKLKLEVYDFAKDTDEVLKYNIEQIPALVVMDEEDRGIRFYGIPAGYEFSSLLSSLLMVSTGVVKLTNETKAFLDYLKQPVVLKVFVTPVCPYCPSVVMMAQQMAYYTPLVRAEMIELSEFPHLAVKYGVQGVPRTAINETVFVDGMVPEEFMVAKIKQSL